MAGLNAIRDNAVKVIKSLLKLNAVVLLLLLVVCVNTVINGRKRLLITFKKAGPKLGLNLNVIVPAAVLKITGSAATASAAAANNDNKIVIRVAQTGRVNIFVIALFFIINVLIKSEI